MSNDETKPSPRKLGPAKSSAPVVPADLLTDLRALIEQARDATAHAVNSALVLLYWSIGDRVRRDILRDKRANYGKQILGTLAQELSTHYGRGYTYDNLTRMVMLAEVFPEGEIVGALSRQLGWSHFLLLLPIKDALKTRFLRRDVPRRAVERPHAPGEDRRDAVRANRPLEEARQARAVLAVV